MTLFGEQGFSRTKRANKSQRESVTVLRTEQPNIAVTILQETTHTHMDTLPHKQHTCMSVHNCTLNISGGSVHSSLLKPQAKCSPASNRA